MQVRLSCGGGSAILSQRMEDAMQVSGKGSQLGDSTPEGQEFIFGQRAKTSEMGSEQHSDVGRRPHSACGSTSREQE